MVPSPHGFEALKTYSGVIYSDFKSVCLARGLIQDDREWRACLEEAIIMQTGAQLRSLFASMLTHCDLTRPENLWEEFRAHICDDIRYQLQHQWNIPEPTDEQVYDFGLHLLEHILHYSSKSLEVDFLSMPRSIMDWGEVEGPNRLITGERNYNQGQQLEQLNQRLPQMNVDQRSAYDQVVDSVEQKAGKLFFLHGPAGTGKTFVYNTLCHKLCSQGCIVLCVASSGIASLLLPGGRTAHSRFKIPLDLTAESSCSISIQSVHAELMRSADLIIWDEAPMQHRFAPEAVDRTLRDVCRTEKPFGGITTVFGGDMKQILPVIVKGRREDVVGAAICRSPLWLQTTVLHLRTNMRLDQSPENAEFAEWLLKVGKGTDLPDDGTIEFPANMQASQNNLNGLIDDIYPDIQIPGKEDSYFMDRTILSARNDEVAHINKEVLSRFPGREMLFTSADEVVRGDEEEGEHNYPTEYLNSITTSGLPLSRLKVKDGCSLMILRNLAPDNGVCNGTRVRLLRASPRVLEVRVMGSTDSNGQPRTAFIPRIKLTTTLGELPFQISQCQFPVRVAFAMTINKSQGQSLKHVGLDLRIPVFTHGQLYVALSRVTSRSGLKLIFPSEATCPISKNYVYKEVLLD